MAKEIEITIDQEGNASIDLMGWKGKGCADVSKEFEKALGTKVKSEQKGEYYQVEQQEKQKIVRGF